MTVTTIATKSKVIGLKELRMNAEKYIKMVQKGASFLVIRRSKPIFKLIPVDEWGDDGVWENVASFSDRNEGGMPIGEFLIELRKNA